MKNLFLVLLLLVCSHGSFAQDKEYITFEADIANLDEPIYLLKKDKVVKKMVKNSKGVYKDTLKVQQGSYKLFDGKQLTQFSLSNSDIKLKMDVNRVDETIVFLGVGSDLNNYAVQSAIAEKKFDFVELLSSDEISIKKKMEELRQSDFARIDKYVVSEKVNASLKSSKESQYAKMLESIRVSKERQAISLNDREVKNAEFNKMNGTISPSFNYRNHKGAKTKLESFKGKYVYIDIWATWCGPCRAEIPYLQKTEEEFHDKNIAFVSISIDKQSDFKKWETMVKEKNLGGVQLIADNDWNSDFTKSFGVRSIPRFILIDPNGKVVNAVAARPSDPELKKVLNQLLK